jgi:hypothetical protein
LSDEALLVSLREEKKADTIDALLATGMVALVVKAGPSEVLRATTFLMDFP